MFRTCDPAQISANYLHCDDPEYRLHCIDACETGRSNWNAIMTGELCVDLALQVDSIDLSRQLFDRASSSLGRVLSREADKEPDATKARKLLASIPLYRDLVLLDKVPDTEKQLKAYHETIVAAQYLGNLGVRHDDDGEINGELSELAVQLVLMRFGINEGREEWIPVPSTYSQDSPHCEDLSVPSVAWDVSVFTKYGQTPLDIDPTYKVQVKAGKHTPSNRTYDLTQVSLVRASRDLRVTDSEKAKAADAREIIEECSAEIWDTSKTEQEYCRRTLDLRTQTLLDAIEI